MMTPSGFSLTRIVPLALVAALAGACSPDQPPTAASFEGESHAYQVVPFVEGLEHPWGMAFLPDGDILVTERAGRLRVVRGGELDPTPVSGVPQVHAQGQGGLLDVALHPDFADNRLVYLSFAKPGPDGTATTAVVRGMLDGNDLVGVEEIFEADAFTGAGVHFGSRLVFDRDGYLYVTVGDRGQMSQAQNPIFAYGIRSPQGLTIHPATGELMETEHGPRGGDELNRIQAGRNYGWPTITYGINYDGSDITDKTEMEGMEQPLHYWVPSIATSGLAIYTGDRFPNWRGSAFVGGLAGTTLARVSLDGFQAVGEERLLSDWGQRIRDVRDGPDGFLYILTDVAQGGIYRLEPAS
jgi:glucose/arabinose dehydrogenase